MGTVTRYFGLLFVSVMSGLVLGTVSFALVLQSAYGILPTHFLFSKKAADGAAPRRIVLLNSGYSAAAYAKMQADHPAQIAVWSNFLKEAGAAVDLIDDAGLERGLDREVRVLALPGSPALSDRELEQIRKFVRAGGGLIMEGPVGTRYGDDRWRGWDFIEELLNVRSVEILKSPGQARRFVTLAQGSPLSVRLPAGVKIENGFYSENYAVTAEAREAYWSEWVRPLAPPAPDAAAVKTGRYGSGRVVWFGFNLGAMSEQTDPHQALIRLLANAMDWSAQQPLAQIAHWPHAEQGAVSLTFDCEADFTNLTSLFERAEARDLRFTFFMLSSVAQKYPDLVKQAAARGEIAVHGDDHTAFGQQPYETQAARLLQAKSLLQALSKTPVESFRPPEQKYDAATLAAMRKVGLKNIFADYLGFVSPRLEWAAAPGGHFRWPFMTDDSTIVRIPRPHYDDYDLFVRHSLDGRQAGEYLVADMDRVTRDGGWYVSSMHTTAPWGGLNPDKLPALMALLHALPGRPLWVATVKDAADWWEKRSQIQVTVTQYSSSVILLQVTNSGRQGLADVPVEVYLPERFTKFELQSSKVEFRAPKWKLGEDGKVIIFIPAIKPGESKSYILTSGEHAA